MGIKLVLYPLRKLDCQLVSGFSVINCITFYSFSAGRIQNIIKSVSVRSINFRNLGLKKSFNVLLILVERLFQNIFLRIDQGAESLFQEKIIIKTNRFRTFILQNLNVIVNTLSIVLFA